MGKLLEVDRVDTLFGRQLVTNIRGRRRESMNHATTVTYLNQAYSVYIRV